MAFAELNLRRVTSGAPVTANTMAVSYWSFATLDAAATVEAGGYFNGATKQLRKGDVIWAHMALGGTPIYKSYIVTSATLAATVTIALESDATG